MLEQVLRDKEALKDRAAELKSRLIDLKARQAQALAAAPAPEQFTWRGRADNGQTSGSSSAAKGSPNLNVLMQVGVGGPRASRLRCSLRNTHATGPSSAVRAPTGRVVVPLPAGCVHAGAACCLAAQRRQQEP